MMNCPIATWSFVVLLFSFPAAGPATQTSDTVRLYDNSDWWSGVRPNDADEEIKADKGEIAASNLQVLGIDLGDVMFERAATKLGKATIVARGDASLGRQQACYVSADRQEKTHLIFERGEVSDTFYLFSGGPDWEGADRCVASKAISRDLATASGLRLAMTPAQVIAVLGKPTKQRANEMVFSHVITKKTSAKDLAEARKRNPNMSERELQANYGHYDLSTGVVAKFADSKLTYLAVTKVETT